MYIVMSIIWQLHLYLDYKTIYPHNKCEDKWYHNCKVHFLYRVVLEFNGRFYG